MRIDAISIGNNPPYDVNVIVEVPIGGEPIKYELDKPSGTMFVDRMLYTAMHYPGNYGFVPHTLSDDGDPIDVLIANSRPIVPGAVCNCRPVGVLFMRDEAGGDEKIIAVPSEKILAILPEDTKLLRPARDAAQPHRAFLRALQGPRRGEMGEDRSLGGRSRGARDDRARNCGGAENDIKPPVFRHKKAGTNRVCRARQLC